MKIDTTRLRRKIAAHVRAQIELVNKGGGDPQDFDAIKYNARAAKKNLDAYINSHLAAPNFIGRLRRLDDPPSKSGRYIVLHKGMIASDAFYATTEGETHYPHYPVGWHQMPAFLPTHWLDAPGIFDDAPSVTQDEREAMSRKAGDQRYTFKLVYRGYTGNKKSEAVATNVRATKTQFIVEPDNVQVLTGPAQFRGTIRFDRGSLRRVPKPNPFSGNGGWGIERDSIQVMS